MLLSPYPYIREKLVALSRSHPMLYQAIDSCLLILILLFFLYYPFFINLSLVYTAYFFSMSNVIYSSTVIISNTFFCLFLLYFEIILFASGSVGSNEFLRQEGKVTFINGIQVEGINRINAVFFGVPTIVFLILPFWDLLFHTSLYTKLTTYVWH
jgi:hypothetical protein